MTYYMDGGLTLQINLKSLCNLDCDYCLLPKHVKSQKDSTSVILDNTRLLIEKIKSENLFIKAFAIFGAEPFTVEPEIMAEVLNLIHEAYPDTHLRIQTNGTLCTTKYMFKFLAVFNYHDRLNLGFSLDGVRDIHNKHRCNSWDLAVGNFLWIKQHTVINTNVICTTNNEHFDKPEYEAELLEFITVMHNNFNTPVNIAYADLTIRGVGDSHIGESLFSKRFANFLIKNNLFMSCNKMFHTGYCYRKGNSCDKTLFDLNDGKTYQCEKKFAPDNDFIIWKDKTIAEVMDARVNETKDYPIAEECNTCEYWDWCNGGCPVKRDVNGLATSCYVTKTVLDHIKTNINPDWRAYLERRVVADESNTNN